MRKSPPSGYRRGRGEDLAYLKALLDEHTVENHGRARKVLAARLGSARGRLAAPSFACEVLTTATI